MTSPGSFFSPPPTQLPHTLILIWWWEAWISTKTPLEPLQHRGKRSLITAKYNWKSSLPHFPSGLHWHHGCRREELAHQIIGMNAPVLCSALSDTSPAGMLDASWPPQKGDSQDSSFDLCWDWAIAFFPWCLAKVQIDYCLKIFLVRLSFSQYNSQRQQDFVGVLFVLMVFLGCWILQFQTWDIWLIKKTRKLTTVSLLLESQVLKPICLLPLFRTFSCLCCIKCPGF